MKDQPHDFGDRTLDDWEEQVLKAKISASDLEQFHRLDLFLCHAFPEFSRTFIKKLFQNEQIESSTEETLHLNRMPKVGVEIFMHVPPPIPAEARPQNIPLEILYEDEDVLFVNKPAGLVTHPAPGNYEGTLVNAILFHCPQIGGIGGVRRPGIVHRLDKGTSGVMIVAKNQKAHEELILKFQSHDIHREYEAITFGRPLPTDGTLTSVIGRHPQHRQKMHTPVNRGKNAITHYKVMSASGLPCHQGQILAHTQFKLETGRTHQIRVHSSLLLKCPLLGDALYGGPAPGKILKGKISEELESYPYPLLHAKSLGLTHPITKKELFFETKPPAVFQEALRLF